MSSMAGKACLITGGSSGIGLAIAQRFAKDGGSVCLAARSLGRLDAAVDTLDSGSESIVV